MGTLISKKKPANQDGVNNGSAAPASVPEVKDEAPASNEAPVSTEEKKEEVKAEETTVVSSDPTDNDSHHVPDEAVQPEKSESVEQPPETKLSEEEAATKIQAIVRGKQARDEVKSMKDDATEAETPAESTETPAEAESDKPTEEEASPEEQEKAAIKIQSSFRGMQARKEVEAMKDSKEEGEKDTPAETETEPPSNEEATAEN